MEEMVSGVEKWVITPSSRRQEPGENEANSAAKLASNHTHALARHAGIDLQVNRDR